MQGTSLYFQFLMNSEESCLVPLSAVLHLMSFFFFLNNVCDPSSGTSENILLQIGHLYEVGKIPKGTGGKVN